jgi:hypothetical protein
MIQLFESCSSSIFLFEHDLFGKPVPAFPDHALKTGLFRFACLPICRANRSDSGGDSHQTRHRRIVLIAVRQTFQLGEREAGSFD